jgi:NodT family efflux transporter outer membrane factor (OMF) lipoprotein
MKRFCFLSLLALSSCMVGPDYHKPKLDTAPAYKTASGWVQAVPDDGAPKGDWWTSFNDPVLNQMEPQVAVNNATVKADYYAYMQAAAEVREAQGQLFPTLGLTGTANRDSAARSSGSSSGSSISTSSNFNTGPSTSGTFEGEASWVPDIWGKIRRQVQENSTAAQVSAADLANATLSTQAALASDYVDLRTADASIALFQQTVAADQRSLQITENQAAAGTAAPSDVITARTALEGAQASLINAGAGRAQFENAIAVLTGQMPEGFAIPPGGQIATVPVAPAGVPSTLLERRPDIAAAERNMAEQNAAVGVAVGAYYPDITLSALGGYSADPIGGLFSVSHALWSLGTDATETLFEGGVRSAAVTAAEDSYDAAEENYRATALSAFQNVEDDLSNLKIFAQQAQVQDQAVADATRATQIALNQYQAGTANYTTVVTAQVTQLQDQQAALSIQQQRLLAAVALYQDLGGGFTEASLPSAAQLQAGLPFAP